MEFITKGSLLDYLRKKDTRDKVSVKNLIQMAVDACSGLDYLEQKGIVVRI